MSSSLPKHIPQSPVMIVSSTTDHISPLIVSPNTAKLNSRTRIVWNTITMNWVTTCEKRISGPVTPDTKQRSNMPSFFSMIMAPDVRATDKKKMILEEEKTC